KGDTINLDVSPLLTRGLVHLVASDLRIECMTKVVGIGFIGTGFAKSVQMPTFAACDGVKLVSVASGSLANAEKAASAFGLEHFTADWRETVAHPDVDLVCITTPPNLHKEMVLFAIEHGKHILAEKPMAMNVAEAEEMTAAAEKAGVLALIDHELRFQPGRQKAWKMIRDGEIGKIRHAKWNFRAPHRGDPNVPWNWWSDIGSGGGALGAINSHIIDSFNWFLGTDVSSVFCQLQTHVKQRPFDGGFRDVTTDDEANMLLRFADGDLTSDATGLVSVSMVEQPEYVNRLELFGTEGAIRIEHRGEVYLVKNGESEWTELEVDLAPAIPGIPDTGFGRGFMAFAPKIVEAIAKGATSIEYAASFEDGLRVQRVLDAARESDKHGKVASLSLEVKI
ncbi:MAG TPA: Gfo/Idh/MocA family oxidoreductase, partial [Pyrinomonadaceae bacterium]|nr:Gfo/Idh/MocA family oxidoreductase [Pyrinomonadaceae bacterium]